MWPAPSGALAADVGAERSLRKRREWMVIDVGDHSCTQTFFPYMYMSDAHRPAVDVQMAAQDACVPLSFWLFLSVI